MVRIAVVEKDKCHPMQCGNYLCARLCPINKTGTVCIVKGEDGKAKIDADLCTGCGICPKRCPYGAIHIINLPESLNKPPIHRYGQNGFHLYNVPAPLFGKVVGILGRNGCGKSTALKILAGAVKPNLGKDADATHQEIINHFRGQEAQAYFEKVRDGRIRVAHKPQTVDSIPKQHRGTVRSLLERTDEKKKLAAYAKMLEIDAVLDNPITSVSGGELQRIAICATALKKANVYLFDEPTSYLDIKQRINVSRFIRSLVEDEGKNGEKEKNAVIVIEHDLVILDFMTDLVHIMYGEVCAYGVVSQPMTSRVGINTYLSGYLKDENMRFRDTPIRFDVTPPSRPGTPKKMVSWNNITKKLGAFSVEAPEGFIAQNEVYGMLGENGIGKTTFVKILAGVHAPDQGTVQQERMGVVVSYKPQYLESESEELVVTVLKDAIEKYDILLVRPLQLKELFTKRLCELSGGELQRVAIAQCLSRNATVYLLDEPSAYLDVEQRLAVARVIRNVMEHKGASCLVVDHDLLFVDYLSHRLCVCSGISARHGTITGPYGKDEGMNLFLKEMNLTFRKDPESHRPRANKPGSQLDQEQRATGKRYG